MVNVGPVSIKPSDTIYIVPAKTAVMVSNRFKVLIDHATKNENRFPGTAIVIGSGITFELGNKLVGVNVSASSLLDSGYHTFMTGNVEWPYMVVKKSVFEDFGPSRLLQLTGMKQLPALTKKQEKNIRNGHCPDCFGDGLKEKTWSKNDSHVVCMDCRSEFRLTDTTIERL